MRNMSHHCQPEATRATAVVNPFLLYHSISLVTSVWVNQMVQVPNFLCNQNREHHGKSPFHIIPCHPCLYGFFLPQPRILIPKNLIALKFSRVTTKGSSGLSSQAPLVSSVHWRTRLRFRPSRLKPKMDIAFGGRPDRASEM